jgi:c-di-GMP-binding flagellar brake protein YcgR
MIYTHEKREYKRITLKSSVYYAELLQAKTVNISGGGVCFETDRDLEEDSTQYLIISLFPYILMKEIAVVAWSRKTKKDRYTIGLEFMHMSEFNRSVIDKFISNSTKKKVNDSIEIQSLCNDIS